jgi:hypothetical protein
MANNNNKTFLGIQKFTSKPNIKTQKVFFDINNIYRKMAQKKR